MPTLVTRGDRQILAGGSPGMLKRNSVPLSMFPGGNSVSLSGSGTISYQQLYETQNWVGIAVNKLNRQIARLPLKVYRQKTDGGRERVRDHPLASLLSNPYPRASATTLKQKIAYPALVHGNAVLFKFREAVGAPPSRLVPLDWRFITPRTDEAGGLIFWETTQFGDTARVDPQDVIHVAWESGMGDIGVSPLKQLGMTLRTEDSAQRYQSSSFERGLGRGGAFVIPADAKTTKDERIELRDHLRSMMGPDKAFDPMLLFAGATWQSGAQTAVEAELIEQRKLNREEIAAVYDIPPPLIGILDKATYSNIDTQHKMLYTDVLGPWLTMIEETLQVQLVDPEPSWAGLRLEFDLAEVLRGDLLAEMQAIEIGIRSAVLTPNRALQIRNEPTSDQPGMDSYYLPMNNLQPVGQPTVSTDVPPAKTMTQEEILCEQIGRVADRVQRKGIEALDVERVERELLAAGLEDHVAAAGWAVAMEKAGSATAIRALAP